MATLVRFEFDAAYVDRLVAGDADVEAHFTNYFGDLISLKLRSRLRTRALVEDVKQEVFLRVVATLRQKGLESAPSLGAFVNTVCNNVLFETYRSQAKARRNEPEPLAALEAQTPNPESAMVDQGEHARVREAIETLPDRDRALLRALFFEERPKDDICRDMGIDRDYLRVMLHRAKAKFRDRFAAEPSSPPRETVRPRPAPLK